jgi:hypothetical protein
MWCLRTAGERGSYPSEALTGRGSIKGRTVDCTPEWLVRFHTGYQVDATDWADVAALCERFSIPVPPRVLDTSSNIAMMLSL